MNDFNQILTFAAAETQFSDVYELKPDSKVVDVEVDVTALAGTSPTVDVTLQFSRDNVTWVDEQALAQLTATGKKRRTVDARYLYFRFKIVLGGTDPTATIDLYAQAKNYGISNSLITVHNVTCTDADTEYSQAFSENTEKVLIRTRTAADLKIAFVSGDSGTTYYTLPAGSGGQWIDGANLRDLTVYFQTPSAGTVVEILEIRK